MIDIGRVGGAAYGSQPEMPGMTVQEARERLQKIVEDSLSGKITPEEGYAQMIQLGKDISNDRQLTDKQKRDLIIVVGASLMAGRDVLIQKYDKELNEILNAPRSIAWKREQLAVMSNYINEFKLDDKALLQKVRDVGTAVDVQEKIEAISRSSDSYLDKYRKMMALSQNLPKLPDYLLDQLKFATSSLIRDYSYIIVDQVKQRAESIAKGPGDPFKKINDLKAYIREVENTPGIDRQSELWNDMDKTVCVVYIRYAYIDVFTELRAQMDGIMKSSASKESKIAQLESMRAKVENNIDYSDEKVKFLADIDAAIKSLK